MGKHCGAPKSKGRQGCTSSRRWHTTWAQHAVDDKTNEITAVETLLHQLVLEGRVMTMAALLTQRHVAQTIVDTGGDYVMMVKENQPRKTE